MDHAVESRCLVFPWVGLVRFGLECIFISSACIACSFGKGLGGGFLKGWENNRWHDNRVCENRSRHVDQRVEGLAFKFNIATTGRFKYIMLDGQFNSNKYRYLLKIWGYRIFIEFLSNFYRKFDNNSIKIR